MQKKRKVYYKTYIQSIQKKVIEIDREQVCSLVNEHLISDLILLNLSHILRKRFERSAWDLEEV